MTFPVEFHLLGRTIPAHAVFELLAYAIGMQLYLWLRRRGAQPRASVPIEKNLWILVGCVFGALVGSKMLAWLESWPDYWANRDSLASLLGGKTIVGGLLGGWVGVEIAKRIQKVTHSNGDLYVFPLAIGMSIGRIGCFLTGLPDHTYGLHTSLPWAVDFGDGPRHPTQLYEIVVLLALATILYARSRRPYRNGELFRWFMLGYFAWRFVVEFIKPRYDPYAGLSAIQIACLLGAAYAIWLLMRDRSREPDAMAPHPKILTRPADERV